MTTNHKTSTDLLAEFVRIMDDCGNWPDTSTSMAELGDLADKARSHLGGATCTHPKDTTIHTGDGTPVSYCPDCGRNEAGPAAIASVKGETA